MKAATANAFYILVVATVRRPVADTFLWRTWKISLRIQFSQCVNGLSGLSLRREGCMTRLIYQVPTHWKHRGDTAISRVARGSLHVSSSQPLTRYLTPRYKTKRKRDKNDLFHKQHSPCTIIPFLNQYICKSSHVWYTFEISQPERKQNPYKN